MSQESIARHLALVVMVLLAVFLYIGWRMKQPGTAEVSDSQLRTAAPGALVPVTKEFDDESPDAEATNDTTTSESIGGTTSSEADPDQAVAELWDTPEDSSPPILPEDAPPEPEELPPPPTIAIERPAVNSHTVSAGDTLFSIAQKHLQSGNRWREIVQANQKLLKGDTRIAIGMQLTIPSAKVPAVLGTYTVKSGDTLSAISRAIYGSSARWKDLYKANTKTIPDPDKLRAGQELVVP